MEVLDSGSYEPIASARATTRTMRSDGQLSLECLPPEVPKVSVKQLEGLSTDHDLHTSGGKVIHGEEKLKGMMTEMTETLNKLCGSVTAGVDNDSSTKLAETAVGSDATTMADETSDPALLKAISKMKKLDSKLADVTKRERKVKRQRRKLEKLLEDGVEPSSALALVQDENGSDQEESSPPPSPVFHTELRDKPVAQTTAKPNEPIHVTSAPVDPTSKVTNRTSRPAQDFIKRNIELVQDAGSLVAMTEDEKKRLELLLDDGTVEDIEEPQETSHHELALISETAFLPDENNLERLREIDSRLEAILPAEDWRSISSSTPESYSQLHNLEFKEALNAFYNEDAIEELEPGDTALMELKHLRSEQHRLKEIDQMLKHLKICDSEISPVLSDDQLKELVDQCRREQGITDSSTQSTPLPSDNTEINDSQ